MILSIPSVQTSIAKKVTSKINTEFNTNINVERIDLKINGDFRLRNVLVKDHKNDTLIYSSSLKTSILNFKNLFNEKLRFGAVDINGLYFNMITYKEETQSNLDVFIESFNFDNPKQDNSLFSLTSSELHIDKSRFHLKDFNKQNSDVLMFDNLNLNATNFIIIDSDITTRLNHMSFNDPRGIKLKVFKTNFTYSDDLMSFNDLFLETKSSTLEGDLYFKYKDHKLSNFSNNVNIEAQIRSSSVKLNEVNLLYDEFGSNEKVNLAFRFNGTLNDFIISGLRMSSSVNTKVDGDLNLKNLFNDEEFSLSGKFKRLTTNYKGLSRLMPNILGRSLPNLLSKLGDFNLRGDAKITKNALEVIAITDTKLGSIESNILMNHLNDNFETSYKGDVSIENFNLGEFIENPIFDKATMDLTLDGEGFSLETIQTKIKGEIDLLGFNNYTYNSISLNGELGNNIFNGEIDVNDDNLEMAFVGLADFSDREKVFDFKAIVVDSDLKILNFTNKDEISNFNGEVLMNFRGSNLDNSVGEIEFINTNYSNENGDYYFEDFKISSKFDNNNRKVVLNSPDIIEGFLSGQFKLVEIPNIFRNSLGSLYSNFKPYKTSGSQFLNFDLNLYSKILEIFDPTIKVKSSVSLKGRVETDVKKFKLKINSSQIEFKGNSFEQLNFEIDNSNPVYNTYISLDSISTSNYKLSNFNFINAKKRDSLFFKTEFNGGRSAEDKYSLNLYYTEGAKEDYVFGIKKSEILFKDNKWLINKTNDSLSKIIINPVFDSVSIGDVLMDYKDEQIKLSGVLKDSTQKDIKLSFKTVDLNKITPAINDFNFEGILDGNLQINQRKGVYFPSADMDIKYLSINSDHFGDFNLSVLGDNTLTKYEIDGSISKNEKCTLEVNGELDLNSPNQIINLDLLFDEFNLKALNPLGQGVINNIRGVATGEAKINGYLSKLNYDGRLILEDSGLGIPYLNVDYNFDKTTVIDLSKQSFILNPTKISDEHFNTEGTLSGLVSHNNFSDWELDLKINSSRLCVLNTEEDESSLYYGSAFMDGECLIYGPTNDLTIDVNARTAKGTIFKIPLKDVETFGDDSFIHFVTRKEKSDRKLGNRTNQLAVGGLDLNFNLDINQNANLEIVVDKQTGSTINGNGNGGLLFQINTNGKFEMFGDFIVNEGYYNFMYKGIIEKKFKVDEGYLSWEGEPMDARINLTAKYATQANPSILLDAPINRSIPVEVLIQLQGQLKQPEPDFDFNFPNLNSSVKSELEYRLDTKEARETQALNVLATGSFASDLNVGQQAYGTVADRVSGLINSLITDDSSVLQLGLDYESGEVSPDYKTDDRLGLTLRTQITDRVIVNGKVGVPVGGVTESVIAGDVQIDLLLNEDGSLVARFFNRENTIRNFGEEIGYTQGLGVSYNIEFDTFREFLSIIFSGKNR